MLFTAYLYDPQTRTKKVLGRVRGRNQPAAWLAACKKYKVPNEQHRRLGCDAVAPKLPPPIPETEKELLRGISRAFNAALK